MSKLQVRKKLHKAFVIAAFTALGAVTLSTGQAQAAVTTLTASNQGWWSSTDTNTNGNDNYITGEIFANQYRNFFTFDLASLAGQVIKSATLQVRREVGAGSPTQTLGFFDVSTPASVLANKDNNPNFGIFNDLGTGENYGTFVVDTFGGSSDEILNFTLNSIAITGINASIGNSFSLGGALLSNVGNGGVEYLFGFSGGGNAAKLVVDTEPVPEPLTILGSLAAGTIGVALRRKYLQQKDSAKV